MDTWRKNKGAVQQRPLLDEGINTCCTHMDLRSGDERQLWLIGLVTCTPPNLPGVRYPELSNGRCIEHAA